MNPLRIEVIRGGMVESVHRVSAAVVDPDDRLVAAAGVPDLVTFWRSAAKPFQALPLVADGAADRYRLDDRDLALACASHSSEPEHLAAVDRFLAKVGATEDQLACGPHPPLSAEVAEEVIRTGIVMTARWSNCSGKHTGMVALARHHGWPVAGYQRAGHPVQDRILEEVERWTGTPRSALRIAVDGCTTVCFGLSLRAMALGYARFGGSDEPAARRLWGAITGQPLLIAGRKRVCTEIMAAWPGELFAKIGAEGIYCAAIPRLRLGLALKVEDGDMASAGIALIASIRQVAERFHLADGIAAMDRMDPAARLPITSTRGESVGTVAAAGQLAFF